MGCSGWWAIPYSSSYRQRRTKVLFEKAIKIKPDYSDAYMNLGMVMYQKNKIEIAKSYYKKALEIDPINIKAHLNTSEYIRLHF